jgi:hypothetical protein
VKATCTPSRSVALVVHENVVVPVAVAAAVMREAVSRAENVLPVEVFGWFNNVAKLLSTVTPETTAASACRPAAATTRPSAVAGVTVVAVRVVPAALLFDAIAPILSYVPWISTRTSAAGEAVESVNVVVAASPEVTSRVQTMNAWLSLAR